jgi:tetratricopeptide (TPR) repeat protein
VQLTEAYLAFKQSRSTQQMHTESLINDLGYQLLDTHPHASLKLFELNTISYPASANVYDSYAEALYQVGEFGMAKINYQKAFDLDPSYTHILERLNDIDTKQ